MATEHSTMTDPELHEPKGVAAASDGQIYIADGSSSGDWRYLPRGSFNYSDVGTGDTITTPTSYTLVAPTTAAMDSLRQVTQNDSGRLTYTGSTTLDFKISASITLKNSEATAQDVYFQVYKNGSPINHEHVVSALTGNYSSISFEVYQSLSTSDYVEVYTKTATGNVIVHSIAMNIEGKV